MKKTIIVAFFSIMAIVNLNAQCNSCLSQVITNSSFTTAAGTYSIDYKDCGGIVEIVSITCNGATVSGSLLFTNAIYFFFNNNPNIQSIEIPATCMKWVITGYVNHPDARWFELVNGILQQNNTTPVYSLQDCGNAGCCRFSRANAGLLNLTSSEPECGIDCFEICNGF